MAGGGADAAAGGGASGGTTASGGAAGPSGSGGRVSGSGGGNVGGASGSTSATVTVDIGTRFQVMEGFGGSLAFYVNFLTEHPNRAEIYNLIFRDLGLDILRVGNWYQTSTVDAPTVAAVAAAAASLGHPPRLLMSSWSPPASLKSNADVNNGGTLIQQTGAYAYDAFGDWWRAALVAYAARGVRPDFISVQNEPDYRATWQTCLFGPIEGVDAVNGNLAVAGYDRAFEAVYARVQTLSPIPQVLGPEVSGIASMKLQGYLGRLNLAHVGAIAHHLYSGGNATNPDSFNTALQGVATAAGTKPRFMTEYAPTPQDMFTTAWLINNAVTVEGVSAYIYWDLTWQPPSGLVMTENPFDTASWTTPRGYTIHDPYYALKHFARWVDTGWTRVGATASAAAVKTSAFVSPDGRQTTLVMLNTGTASLNVTVSTGAWTFSSSDAFQTVGADRTRELGPLAGSRVVVMPARSIVTVTFTQ